MIFPLLTLLAALSLAAISEWFSIIGVMSIYAGFPLHALLMGIVLGGAKLIIASWLYREWKFSSWKLKIPLMFIVAGLMSYTSIGVYGFLSKAHLEQGTATIDNGDKIARLDQQITRDKAAIADDQKIIDQLDTTISSYLGKDRTDRSVYIRRQQEPQRKQLRQDIEEAQKRIDKYSDERLTLQSEVRKYQLDVGPIRYIAELFYGTGNTDQNIEAAVRMFTLLIVICLDPAAVILLVAANFSMMRRENEKKEKSKEPNISPLQNSSGRCVETSSSENDQERSLSISKQSGSEDALDEKKEIPGVEHIGSNELDKISGTSSGNQENVVYGKESRMENPQTSAMAHKVQTVDEAQEDIKQASSNGSERICTTTGSTTDQAAVVGLVSSELVSGIGNESLDKKDAEETLAKTFEIVDEKDKEKPEDVVIEEVSISDGRMQEISSAGSTGNTGELDGVDTGSSGTAVDETVQKEMGLPIAEKDAVNEEEAGILEGISSVQQTASLPFIRSPMPTTVLKNRIPVSDRRQRNNTEVENEIRTSLVNEEEKSILEKEQITEVAVEPSLAVSVTEEHSTVQEEVPQATGNPAVSQPWAQQAGTLQSLLGATPHFVPEKMKEQKVTEALSSVPAVQEVKTDKYPQVRSWLTEFERTK